MVRDDTIKKSKTWLLWTILAVVVFFLLIEVSFFLLSHYKDFSPEQNSNDISPSNSPPQNQVKQNIRCGEIYVEEDNCDKRRTTFIYELGCLDLSCYEKDWSGMCIECYCFRCFNQNNQKVDREGNLIR